jgi:hypothetical protein
MSQQALDAALQNLTQDDQTFAELMLRRAEFQKQIQKQYEAAARNQQMNAVQNLASYMGGKSFVQQHITAAQQCPPPLDEESPRADKAQELGLAAMNPIARHRFEGIINLMGIKVRFTNAGQSREIKQWILARMGKDGRMIRQEWTAPSKDPGCSLLTWEAMIKEFLDEVARRDGIEIPKDHDEHNSVESAGNEAASSAGNS